MGASIPDIITWFGITRWPCYKRIWEIITWPGTTKCSSQKSVFTWH